MKHYFYQIFLVILTSFMIACSDDDSIIYPDDTTYHEVDSLVGRIAYDSNHGNWVVYPEIAGYSPVPVGDHLPIMIIEGFKESYKVFKDNIVLIRGKYKKLYTVVRNANLGDEDVYYSVQIDTIELFDRVRTRSAGINEIDEDYCGTTSSSSPEWTEWSLMKKAKAYSPYYTYDYEFRTFLHVVRYSDGSNPLNTTKEQIAQEMIAALNSYYSESGITFKNIGSEYIDSDNWNKISAKNARNIFYHYSNSNAIDIFVFSGADNLGNLAGEAKDIPSTALLVNRDYYKKTTIAHEVGHCLGLFHTHHGTFSGESNNATPELVDGSNSAIAGDYVVDTPADPNAWLYGMYSGNGKDANGDLYPVFVTSLS